MVNKDLRNIRLLLIVWLGLSLLLSGCSLSKDRNWTKGKYPQQTTSKSKFASKPKSCSSPYRVRNGETLSGIAQKCGVDLYALADTNQIGPPYRIYVGQELTVPTGKTRSSKSKPFTPKKTAKFAWPMKRKQHQFVKDSAGNHALVIKAKTGEGVYAVASGEVVYSGEGIQHFGKMVIVKHRDNYLTIYAHNQTLAVKEGQQVKQGQLLSTVGMSGTVKSPQLYFEVRYRGRKVDAKPFFKP